LMLCQPVQASTSSARTGFGFVSELPFALSLSKGGSEAAVVDAAPIRSGFDRPERAFGFQWR
jgi:hypothetical protein